MTHSGRGLGWLNMLLAGMGSAYGAYVPVYLTAHAWTQTRIGAVLTVATVVSMFCQVPAALIVDAYPRHRGRILIGAVVAAGAAPAILAILPLPLPVALAMTMQAAAGSLLGPAIAALSLAIAGRAGLGEQLGVNGRNGSIGAGLGAAVLGAFSTWFPDRTVFLTAALLTLPALLALRTIGAGDAVATPVNEPHEGGFRAALALLRDRRLAVFALALVLFQTSSIAILQLAAVQITARLGSRAGAVIAACLIVPQVVVALVSPWVGRAAQRYGRRPLLLAAFAMLPARAALFASVRNPYALVPAQALEGVSGSVYGMMLSLVSADLTHGKGHYTLCMSLLGLAGGAGTAISTALAGWVADGFGRTAAYWVLAGAGLLAWLTIALAMPETRDTIAIPETRDTIAMPETRDIDVTKDPDRARLAP